MRGEGVLILIINDNAVINFPMKSCLSSGKTKDSSKVLASVQSQPDSSNIVTPIKQYHLG